MSNRANVAKFLRGLADEEHMGERMVTQMVQAFGFKAMSGIVFNTPVKSGRARGSWQATLDVPAQPGFEELLDRSGTSTISKAKSTISQFRGFRKLFITSNLAYIIRLEDGYSGRAPKGMVSITLESLTR